MRILVFAPHNDDEVLGVGGTIARFAKEGHDIYVCAVTGRESYEPDRIVMQEAKAAHALLGVKETIFLRFTAVTLTGVSRAEFNGRISEVVNQISPSIVFIPFSGDIHADHQEVNKACLVALRPPYCPSVKQIYAYETLSETEWNEPLTQNAFVPNTWIDISTEIEMKEEAMLCYQSQLKDSPHPRSLETIRALAKVRGNTVNVDYAEAFMLIRSII